MAKKKATTKKKAPAKTRAVKKVKILFIDNAGGGFADWIQVPAGTTANAFFKAKMGRIDPKACLIRVNRDPVDAKTILKEGDRITITPTKIRGG